MCEGVNIYIYIYIYIQFLLNKIYSNAPSC